MLFIALGTVPLFVQLRRLCHGNICGIQHIFNKYTVSRSGIVYEDVRHGTDQLTVLNYRRAAHECGQ